MEIKLSSFLTTSNMKLSFLSSFFFIFHLLNLLYSAYADDKYYEACNKPFQCGTVSNLSYPFYDGQAQPDYCGYPGFKLDCSSIPPDISVTSSERYYVLGVQPDQPVVAVARKDYWNGYCPENLRDTRINATLFSYVNLDENVTFYYDCPNVTTPVANSFLCANFSSNARNPYGYFVPKDLESIYGRDIPRDRCNRSITVPITNQQSSAQRIRDTFSLMSALRYGFELQWNAENSLCDECRGSGGKCGYNTTMSRFTCYCSDHPYASKCLGHTLSKSKIMILAFISGSGIGICMLIVLILYLKRKYPFEKSQDVEVFLKSYGSPGPKRYTYAELKRITDSFKEKLGEGGYGVVYKGKLHNDHLVAVKILKKSKGEMDEFINEVASIGKTNHINIVKLLGFCYEGHKRALVYSFMPNGSLEKFTYGEPKNHQKLSWGKLFDIAVGIARGLEYLHRGCNTRILHLDIKPQNILLDENFCPKISDFGLAMSCLQKNSIISMSEARGTIGYIAPEVFLKSFGGVSYKSDVYSYGMLVLEIIGCRNNADAQVECTTEQYFPDWIYKQLEQVEDVDHQGIADSEEGSLRRKMVLVSLWCIQTSPSSRPTMTQVVEMLEGTFETLQIPPMPSFASPLRSQKNTTTMPTTSIDSIAETNSYKNAPIDVLI